MSCHDTEQRRVWVLIEEDHHDLEQPSYLALSVHRTIGGADAARDRWRANHSRDDGNNSEHAFHGAFCPSIRGDGACTCVEELPEVCYCGLAITMDELEG